jgi:hypothetical protein
VRRSQSYSRMRHALISAYGAKWDERYLAMFAIYIDDSGSSPEQKLVVASGLIIPARQLIRFESEWDRFLEKERITVKGFHTSECLAKNPHSEFAGWDDTRIKRVFARVRQMTFKYFIKAFCIAIYKKDYTEVMPEDMRKRVGSFYTWAASSVLGMAYDWATHRAAPVPMEYVFDTANKEVKREIDDAMECSEQLYPGHFMGHYSFRKRNEVPALQAVDLFAWTCYQKGIQARASRKIPTLAEENWVAYRTFRADDDWCKVESLNRQGIEDWVKKMYLGPEDLRVKECKDRLREARKPKKGGN